ncbi:MAG: ABC transporter substrate-binding protein [Chitinophagaceae bacterium]|nr:ABC transporter substrate-binding protein [Rubrivivax sp.]
MKSLATWAGAMAALSTTAASFGLAATASAQSVPIKIGVLTSFSGTLAPVGQQVKWGFELAATEINAAGGILGRPIQLIEEDDESNPTVAARKAEKLLQQDKVDFITGMIHSGGSLAVAQIAERNGRLAATTVSYSSNITGAQCSPNMFRVSAHAGIQAAALTAWLNKNAPAQRYMIVAPDYEMGRDAGGQFEAGVKRGGGSVVGTIRPPLGAKDFSTYFGELRSSRPDVLLTMTPGNDTVRLLTQMRDAGLIGPKLTLAGAAGAVSRGNLDALQGAAENFLTAASFSPDLDLPQGRKFVAAFTAAYKVSPDLFAADSYSLFHLLKVAGDKAGSFETDRLRAALRGTTWDTPSGRRTMRAEDQQASLDMVVIRVKGQDFVVVDRVPAASITIPDECTRF